MADNQRVQPKKTKTKKIYKYPVQPMMVPVGPQPVIYPQPIMGQPQPIYPVTPQPIAMPAMQQVQINPQTGNPVIAVPVGPPVTVAQPIAPPTLIPAQPVATPVQPQVIAAPVVTPQPPVNQKPTIIIKRYYPKDDGCCNIF